MTLGMFFSTTQCSYKKLVNNDIQSAVGIAKFKKKQSLDINPCEPSSCHFGLSFFFLFSSVFHYKTL